MTQPDLDFFTSRGLVVKAESAEGVDPSGTPALNAFEIMEGKSGTEFDKVERKRDRPYFTNDPFSVTNKRAFIEGSMELTPPEAPGIAGTTGTASCEVVLLPCGMARTTSIGLRLTRLNPISRAIPSAFCYWWHAGTYREVSAARGNITGLKMEIGQRFMANLRLQGTYTEIDEDALPTDFNYTAFVTPTVAEFDNTQMVVNVFDKNGDPVGTADLHLWGKMLSVDYNNTIATKQFTEKKVTNVSDRKATFTARFARPDKSDFDVYASRDAAHIVVYSFRLDERAPDTRYSMLVTRGQMDQITDTDIEGDFGYEVTGNCIASDGGGDEFYIAFSESDFAVYFNFSQPKVENVVATYVQPVLSGDYVEPVTWSISVGSLPTGLAINSSTGAITGTPTTPGSSAFTIHVVDSTAGTPLTADVAGTLVITA